MSLVLALADLNPDQVKHRTRRDSAGITNTTFFRASSDAPNSPAAFLGESVPGRWSSAHYHAVDQFQIIVDGKGRFGRHHVFPYCIHFSRAYTPYGPYALLHMTRRWGCPTKASPPARAGGMCRMAGAARIAQRARAISRWSRCRLRHCRRIQSVKNRLYSEVCSWRR